MRIGGLTVRSDSLTSVSGSIVSTQGPNQVAVNNRLHTTLSAAQSTNLTTSDHVKFDTILDILGTAITLDTSTAYTNTAAVASVGRFTLQVGYTYRLIAGIGVAGSATGDANFQWYNSTTSTAFGIISRNIGPTNAGGRAPNNVITGYITPTATTLVELRMMQVNDLATIDPNTTTGSSYALVETINAYVPVASTTYSYIRRTNGATRGATNTNVTIYSNAAESSGSDITYVNSATNGDSFTINTTGIYAVSASALGSTSQSLYINVGSAITNTVATSTVRATDGPSGSGTQACACWIGPITAGQIVFIQNNAALNAGDSTNQVTIQRIA